MQPSTERPTEADFLSHVAAHAGDLDLDVLGSATRAVLSVIGAHLDPALRGLVADELCPSLGAVIVRAQAGLALPIQEHVRSPGMTVSHADELIASVLKVLAEALSNDTLEGLRRALPATLARGMVRSAGSRDRDADRHAHDTLAEGRPGSHHPLGDYRAPGGQPDSIAASNPHGDSKLSSSPGATQEREHETLAEGHPGSSRPLARRH